ncbi:MAG TPA: hypothetical protein VHC20_06485 [Candidatus Paceibacterota bacterium]|nr:hypothetical protein [Candidatus Paceibacterota bacterium]
MTYQLDVTRKIRDQHLTGETVVLSERDNDCHGMVGCTFSSGTLKLARQLSKWPVGILSTVVTDSDVVAVKPQKAYQLFRAHFINCKFHGVFSGVSFGRSPRTEFDGDFGGIENCDFTDATLDGCRFFNVDASTLRLPEWPHVVLHDFNQRAHDVAATTWPGKLGQYMRICADQPESLKVSVIHVPSIAGLVACTEEEIREAFKKFGLVK